MTAPVSSMQIVVGEQYRVLYDFVAHDEGELGVQSGDTVTVVELPEIESGWVLVENMGARTKKKGFVPLAYLGDLFDSQRDESTRRRADSSERRTLLDTIPRHSQNPTQPATGPKREGSVSVRSENPDTLSAATAQYDQSRLPCDTSTDPPVMLLNDAYHRQLVRQRQEAFERMEQCLGAVSQELRSCRDRNTQLTRKIREVESFLENERRRWKQRLDEESTMLGQKSTLLHMMPSSAVDSNF